MHRKITDFLDAIEKWNSSFTDETQIALCSNIGTASHDPWLTIGITTKHSDSLVRANVPPGDAEGARLLETLAEIEAAIHYKYPAVRITFYTYERERILGVAGADPLRSVLPADPSFTKDIHTPPKPLPCRLGELLKEWKEQENAFNLKENTEASCTIFACAEQLKELMGEYFAESRAFIVASGAASAAAASS